MDHLVGRDVLPGEGGDVLRSEFLAGLEHDECPGQLPRLVVRDTDDRRVGDPRVRQEQGLQLGRCHLEALDLDQLLDTIDHCQVTVRVNIPGGREIRDVDLAISAPGGVIYLTSIIRANSGTPPTKTQAFAIIGGTGKYEGVAGQAIHSGFNAQGSKISFFFVE